MRVVFGVFDESGLTFFFLIGVFDIVVFFGGFSVFCGVPIGLLFEWVWHASASSRGCNLFEDVLCCDVF